MARFLVNLIIGAANCLTRRSCGYNGLLKKWDSGVCRSRILDLAGVCFGGQAFFD
jgi:hypothetical protein